MARRPSLTRILLTSTILASSTAAAVGVGISGSPAATLNPTLVWKRELPGATVRESSPALADLDGDGALDVVFGAHDKNVYALSGRDGSYVPGWPQPTTNAIDSSPSVADVTGDGRPELFVGSGVAGDRSGALYSFDNVGRTRFRRALPDPDYPNGGPVHGSPALADINGDGVLEANVGALMVRSLWSVRATDASSITGRELFYWGDTMFASPAVVDVTGDGIPEVIAAGDSSPGGPIDYRGGMVRAIDARGRSLWEFRINDIVRSSPAIGDIDGDGRLEVVFGAGDYWHGSDATSVFAVDAATGQLKWRRATDGVTDGGPALADIDGDGRLDVAIGTFNSPGIRPGDPGLGVKGGSVYALSGTDGSDLPGFPRASGGGAVLGGIVTADIDGAGAQDLIVPTGALLAAFAGRTGEPLFQLAVGDSVAFQGSAAVADVDGDGRLDVLAVGTRVDGTGIAYRWALPATARLGGRGWHQFHKDGRRTGSWTSEVPDAATLPFDRTAGADRYATAVALSSGARTGSTVFVATGTAFADALAGGPAAARAGAALLLTATDQLPAVTRQRLAELAPSSIVVLGGPAAVSDAVVTELEGLTRGTVTRIAGGDRFATAAAVSASGFSSPPVAFVATGFGFADALAGAATGALEGGPVLLAEPGRLPEQTEAELRRLHPGTIVILGGSAAIGTGVEAQLRSISPNVSRVAGADRFATAVELSRRTYPGGADVAYIATGAQFPDALAGGLVAAASKAPMLLVPGACVPLSVRAELERLGVTRLRLLGGASAVSGAIGALTPC